ncbi:4'-phosphopantetheinyl transferase family protein [Streptomyces caeni]|uniref:4'-phosphopantetheinyl transferase family protein n=1 Tax=Streptomyces caeni TaxID=2307231 RepID=A0ABW4ISE7_9ACTN
MTTALTAHADHRTYTTPARLGMPPGCLDLWVVRGPRSRALHGLLAAPELSEAERRRAVAFRRPRDGALYACTHLVLRRLLGAYLGVAPRDLTFVRDPCPGCGGPHGRPAVVHHGPPLHFSLGHSHGMALIGVAATVLGVDVQRLPREETVATVSEALHPDERAELAACPPARRPSAFGQLWTRKEAYLKALGTGLSRGTAADYVGTDPSRRPPGWTLIDIRCGPEHQGAAALRGAWPAHIRTRWLGRHRPATNPSQESDPHVGTGEDPGRPPRWEPVRLDHGRAVGGAAPDQEGGPAGA